MATTTVPIFVSQTLESSNVIHPPKILSSIETQDQSADLISQLYYEYTSLVIKQNDETDPNNPEHSVPVIDFTLLTSSSPEKRSKVVHDLRSACENWGFFMVINHGVPESLVKMMIEESEKFFDMPEEEKKKVPGGDSPLDPVNYGTDYHLEIDKVHLWREFLKVRAHPEFHSVNNSAGFSEAAMEFGKITREIATEIIRGISESLGLEANYIEGTMNWEKGLQLVAANNYPPCTKPEVTMGVPPHTDHGLITLLLQNDTDGLQVQHNGTWITWKNSNPNAFVVMLGDHMQILSNDKYKGVWHRGVVNSKAARISIAVLHGSSFDTVVEPAAQLLEREGQVPAHVGMSYKEYLELLQSTRTIPL